MKTLKYILIAVVFLNIFGCSVGARMSRRSYNAAINYVPQEVVKYREDTAKIEVKEPYALKRGDSIIGYIMPTAVIDGERVMAIQIPEVVIVAKAVRNIPERFGKVSVDFVVTLPKELIGSIQSVVVTPFLDKDGDNVPLQDLTIRGGLFSRVQERNYWQYDRYKEVYSPDSIGEKWAYDRFINFPYPEGVRLDSVVEHSKTMAFHYTQEVSTDGVSNKMLVTLRGRVEALDRSRYELPLSDTLAYNISSMLYFVDTVTRYRKEIVEKFVYVQDRNFLNFKVNDTKIIDSLGDNAEQLSRIEELMDKILNQNEFYVDSIILTATASPEGGFRRNDALAKGRAESLRDHILKRFKGDDVTKILAVRWIGEDWAELERLIRDSSGELPNRDAILAMISTYGDGATRGGKRLAQGENMDALEREIKAKYPDDYRYMLQNIYPLLRAVTFKYDLRRVGMVQDTIHTTVPDERYAEGMQLLGLRKYAQALEFLWDYNDRNTAIILLSLGYDKQAYEVLCSLADTPKVLYLRAIAAVRIGKTDEGLEYFRQACELNPELKWRGKLDPEISELIKNQEYETTH